MAIVLGCDPGAKGAYCLLIPSQELAWFCPTPGGTQLPGFILSNLQDDGAHLCDLAMIEDVHSLYGMSAKSNFSFGGNVQAAQTVLEILMYPNEDLIEKVQPKVWQKAIGVTAKGAAIKKQVAEIAHSLYPYAKIFGPKGGLLDGRADALMIAHYAYLKVSKNEADKSIPKS